MGTLVHNYSMRAFFLVFVALLVGACHSEPLVIAPRQGEPVYGHVVEAAALEAKAVALVSVTGIEVRAYCSGVWVSDSTILTANHCVADMTAEDPIGYVVRDDVYSPGEYVERLLIKARIATLIARDGEHDLALLRTKLGAPPHGVAHTTMEAVTPGMFVQTMGQPLGLWWSYSSGDVAAVRMQEGATNTLMLFVQTTAPTSPGNSGGALFDAYGAIVGVCHGSYTRGHGLHLFVHYSYVDALLKRSGV